MIKKYKVGYWYPDEISVFLIGNEEDLSSFVPCKFEKYFDTWDAARNYLVGKAGRAVESAEMQLVRAVSELEQAKAIPLQEPADA